MALSSQEIQKLKDSGFSDADIADYERSNSDQAAAPAAAAAAPVEAPSVPFDPNAIPTTQFAPPLMGGSVSQNITEGLGAANSFLGSPVGHVVEAGISAPYIKKALIDMAKKYGEARAVTNPAPTPTAAPAPTPVAPPAAAPAPTPNYAPPGAPTNVTQMRPGAAPPMGGMKESISVRNMTPPQPNELNGGNTFLQRMAQLSDIVSPYLGRAGVGAAALITPGNAFQQTNEEAELLRRRRAAGIK